MIGTIIDIALVVVAAIALIVGISKGFVRQLTGLLTGLVAFVGAIVLTSLIMKGLQETQLYLSFTQATTGWFQKECYTSPVTTVDELTLALSGSGALRILSVMAPSLFEEMQTLGCTTLGELLGRYVANIIADFVIWLILYIALKFLFKGIKILLEKITHLPVIKTLDRIFGALWSVAICYIIVIGFVLSALEIVMIKFFAESDFWVTIQSYIQSSKILTFANDTNILGSLIADMLQVELPTFAAPAA